MIRYENGVLVGGYRIIADHLGSPRLVVDANSGAVALRRTYDAFGRVLDSEGSLALVFGYAGGLYDPLTGLVRFGARDYDAETGRWTAKDPIGFAGGDPGLYGYVLGDPVNFVDPEGLTPVADAANRLICLHGAGALAEAERLRSVDPQDLFNAQVEYYLLGQALVNDFGMLGYYGALAVGTAYIGAKAAIQVVVDTPSHSQGGFALWYAFMEGVMDSVTGTK